MALAVGLSEPLRPANCRRAAHQLDPSWRRMQHDKRIVLVLQIHSTDNIDLLMTVGASGAPEQRAIWRRFSSRLREVGDALQ